MMELCLFLPPYCKHIIFNKGKLWFLFWIINEKIKLSTKPEVVKKKEKKNSNEIHTEEEKYDPLNKKISWDIYLKQY